MWKQITWWNSLLKEPPEVMGTGEENSQWDKWNALRATLEKLAKLFGGAQAVRG